MSMSVAEAREYVRQHASEGVSCPCCDQLVQLYKRAIHAEMAWVLCQMVARTEPGQWISLGDIITGGIKKSSDVSYLKYWEAVETKSKGIYRATDRGRRFVAGDCRLAKAVFVVCGKLVNFSSEYITIHEALGTRFNYEDLFPGDAQ